MVEISWKAGFGELVEQDSEAFSYMTMQEETERRALQHTRIPGHVIMSETREEERRIGCARERHEWIGKSKKYGTKAAGLPFRVILAA